MRDPGPAVAVLTACTGVSALWVWPLRTAPRFVRIVWCLVIAVAVGLIVRNLGWPHAPSRFLVRQIAATGCIIYLGTFAAGAAIAAVLSRVVPTPPEVGSPGAGRIIGILERALLIAVFPIGGADAVALVFAAKQIARLPSIQQAEDSSAAAEYVLVGSLLSVVVGLAGGLALDWILN